MPHVMHPNGEIMYHGLPSLSDLMLARDDPTKRIRFVNGNPVIEDAPKRRQRKRRASK
jgi:hypothetical protein